MDDVFKFLDRKYPEQYCKLLKAQLSLINKAPKGSRYSDEFKQFALTVYFLGPKAYKTFSTICRLPSKSTLHRFTKNWIVEPGFNDFIFRVIEFRIGLMKEKERYCILCLDEISLKSHLYYDISRDKIVGFQTSLNGTSTDIASSALTVMVRGLASNWKIPLAYFFYKTSATSDDLKDILFKTVRRCKSIGLNVMGVVSDQGSNFQKLVKTLNVTDENPIFLIDDHELIYLVIFVSDAGTLDHLTVNCSIPNCKVENKEKNIYGDFHELNRESFNNDLSIVHWDDIYDTIDVNDMISLSYGNLMDIFNKHAPNRTKRVTKPLEPWHTYNIKEMISRIDKPPLLGMRLHDYAPRVKILRRSNSFPIKSPDGTSRFAISDIKNRGKSRKPPHS
ncbi:uncharacterized protein [Leptinotarsa decemlineata]|uniref:uncharacterized protein n=1 Tax=Leptinotarsa decemlineata TaxID=7539 RepID=UPI003D3095A8